MVRNTESGVFFSTVVVYRGIIRPGIDGLTRLQLGYTVVLHSVNCYICTKLCEVPTSMRLGLHVVELAVSPVYVSKPVRLVLLCWKQGMDPII